MQITNNKIKNSLRRLWHFSNERKEALKKSKDKITSLYKCNKCKKLFNRKLVQVDHITNVSIAKNWDEYIDYLFCDADKLQVLCISCHLKKTKTERKNETKHDKTKSKKTTTAKHKRSRT